MTEYEKTSGNQSYDAHTKHDTKTYTWHYSQDYLANGEK
jgi:hypothetical protein